MNCNVKRNLGVFFTCISLLIIGLGCSNKDNPVINDNHAPRRPVINLPAGSPSHSSTNQSTTPNLSWTCSDPDRDELTYDVHFGTSSTPPVVSRDKTSQSYSPGTLEYSKKYYWQIVAKDSHGATAKSDLWSFYTKSEPVETISIPSNPTGTGSGQVNQALFFSAGGSSSSKGHAVQYRFDWGDGNYSGWSSSTNASHSWSQSGIYEVKALAHCSTHTNIISSWSTAKTVTIIDQNQPVLAVSTESLSFGSTLTSLVFSISNTGTVTLSWNISNNQNWITVSSSSGTTASETDQINVTVDRSTLSTGSYTGTITVSSDAGIKTIGVSMQVASDPVPDAPNLQTPANGSITEDKTPYFDWTSPAYAYRYEIIVDNDIDFTSPEGHANAAVNSNTTPTSDFAEGKYYWKVRAQNSSGTWGSWSSVWSFTIITSEPCNITVTNPTTGSFWSKGDPATIRWDKSGDCGSSVKIELFKGGTRVGTISSSTSNDGSRSWTVDDFDSGTGTNYRTKVIDLSTGVYDYSEYFSIAVAEPCNITVTNPTTGSFWSKGDMEAIRWDKPGVCGSSVKIELFKGGTRVGTISSSTSNDGLRYWTVDDFGYETGSNYRIKVIELSTGISDYSEYFSIAVLGIEYGSTYFTENAFLTIPDNGGTANRACVSFTTDVPGTNAQIDSVRFEYAINHTYVGDLGVYLETGSTRKVLWDREGGSGNNIVETLVLHDWKDFSADRTWNWCAIDFSPGDEGQLAFWKMTVYWRRSL